MAKVKTYIRSRSRKWGHYTEYQHRCPKCGRRLKCDVAGPYDTHFIDCPEHGMQSYGADEIA